MSNGFLDEGIPVNRETIESAIESIALSCCRGPVQMSVVIGMIENGVIRKERIPNPFVRGIGYSWKISGDGKRGITTQSWDNLRARLINAGFRFEVTRDADIDGTLNRISYHPYLTGGVNN